MICLVYDHTARSSIHSIKSTKEIVLYSQLLLFFPSTVRRPLPHWPGVPFPWRKLFYDLPCARHKIGNLRGYHSTYHSIGR